MAGFIKTAEVKKERDYIVATWGVEFYKAALAAPEGTTFLALLVEHGKL